MDVQISPIEQKLVNFNGAEIMTVKASDDKIYIGVRWVCRGLGLTDGQIDNQQRKINADPVLSRGTAKMQTPTESGVQEVLFLELDFLPLWLAKVNVNLIEDQVVLERIIEYQLHAKDVLAAAFIRQNLPATPTEALLQAVQILAEQERQIKMLQVIQFNTDQKLDNLRQKQDWQDQRLEDVRRGLVDVNMPLRAQFNKAVRDLAIRKGKPFDQAYDEVYETLSTQEHIDIKRRAENRGVKPIDIVEQSDLLVKATRLAKAL